MQAVKDVVQSLVDDDMIEMEKIGSSNFYWAFPSKASRSVRRARVLGAVCGLDWAVGGGG